MKVVWLSALYIGHLVLVSVKRLSQPQGHSAAGRIKDYVIEKSQWHHREWNLRPSDLQRSAPFIFSTVLNVRI